MALYKWFYLHTYLLNTMSSPRDAMLARYMLSWCVCPSVCPFVTYSRGAAAPVLPCVSASGASW